jgi:hypothetical protein
MRIYEANAEKHGFLLYLRESAFICVLGGYWFVELGILR